MRQRGGKTSGVTIREVARAAFVSISTASTALSGGRHVHPETRARVQAAAKKLGYSPGILARSLRGVPPPFLAIMGFNLHSWPHHQILKSIVESLRRREHMLFVLPENVIEPQEAEKRLESLSSQGLISGLIVQIGHGIREDLLVGLLGSGITIVTTEIRIPGAHSVCVDNLAGGRLAAERLGPLSRRFVVISAHDFPSWANDRVRGFTSTLLSGGHRVRQIKQSLSRDFNPEEGQRLAQRLSIAKGSGLGIFCPSGDAVAVGLLKGLFKRGLKPRKDFNLIGYDDTPAASTSLIGLTTVRQPFDKLGSLAVEMAVVPPDAERPEPRHVLLPPTLVIRETA